MFDTGLVKIILLLIINKIFRWIMKKQTWYSLDNAAKIFPCISKKDRPNMYKVSVTLVEEVNKDILQQTLETVLIRFPSFKVKIKSGIFWYYLDNNPNDFVVTEEQSNIFDFDLIKQKNGYLFNVSYYKNKISLTMFHSLTDGTGAMEFLKTIVYQYLKYTGKNIESEGLILLPDSPTSNEEVKDNFLKYYDKNKSKGAKEVRAYHVEGTNFEYGGVGLIIGTTSVAQVKALAKKYGVTLTTYLCALYTYACYKASYLPDKPRQFKNPIGLLVPANMRKIFNDDTMRNYAGFVRLITPFKPDLTLDEIIKDYHNQMQEKLTKENLLNAVNSNVKFEKMWIIRIMPLFLKNIVMRIAYNIIGDNLHTSSVSNLGIITLPESMKPYVKNFYFDLGASYSITRNFGICSYNGKLNLSFSRSIIETSVEKEFFRALSAEGVELEINSNYWEVEEWKNVQSVM